MPNTNIYFDEMLKKLTLATFDLYEYSFEKQDNN